MSSVSSISSSGMNAARIALSASAFNIANLGTDGFRRQQVERTSMAPAGVSATLGQATVPGDAMVTDLVDMLQANNAFLANLAVFKTSAKMAGTLLDAIG
jgi:flagellar hook protein FlgE